MATGSNREICLEVLGSHYAIRSDDPRWIDLVGELWEPFVCSTPAHVVLGFEISGMAGAWSLTVGAAEPDPDPDPWSLLDDMRYTMVQDATERARGIVVLHAGVVARAGEAIVLAGASRSGKTTLTLALVDSGWDYLSDDLAPIEIDTGSIQPFQKPLSVRNPHDWARLLEAWEPPSWLPAPEETLVIPATAFGPVVSGAVHPRVLALPRFGPNAPNRSTQPSAARALATCAEFVADVSDVELGVLRALVTDVTRVEMSYRSSAEALRQIKQLLEKDS